MVTQNNETTFEQRLLVNSVILVLILKLAYVFKASYWEFSYAYAESLLVEASLFFLTYFLFLLLKKMSRRVARIIYSPLMLGLLFFSFMETPMLLDLQHYPINIFALSPEVMYFYYTHFIELSTLLGVIGLLIFLYVFSIYLPNHLLSPKHLKIFAIIIFVTGVLLYPSSFHPLIYSIKQEALNVIDNNNNVYQLKHLAKVKKEVAVEEEDNFKFLHKGMNETVLNDGKYSKIVYLLMESVHGEQYEQETETYPLSFINHCINYDNYHTLNLDSYTSMIAIMISTFAPYQAYVNESNFGFISYKENLITSLNNNNYQTVFLTTYELPDYQLVPAAHDFDQMLFETFPRDAGFECVDTGKINQSCEDLAALDKEVELLKEPGKVFVFHELVYGHLIEWLQKVKMTPVQYYNYYFNTLVQRLEEENLLDDTLIIVTADHGERGAPTDLEYYRVPLYICPGDAINKGEEITTVNQNFYSHLNFQDILMSFLAGKESPEPASEIYLVGNSAKMVYGKLTASGDYILIDDHLLHTYTNMTVEKVREFSQSFARYINYFQSLRNAR